MPVCIKVAKGAHHDRPDHDDERGRTGRAALPNDDVGLAPCAPSAATCRSKPPTCSCCRIAGRQRASIVEGRVTEAFTMRVGNIVPGERVSVALTLVYPLVALRRACRCTAYVAVDSRVVAEAVKSRACQPTSTSPAPYLSSIPTRNSQQRAKESATRRPAQALAESGCGTTCYVNSINSRPRKVRRASSASSGSAAEFSRRRGQESRYARLRRLKGISDGPLQEQRA